MILDNETLEYAAGVIEERAGNPVYRSAWRTAAKVIRGMKNKVVITEVLIEQPEKLNDSISQITST